MRARSVGLVALVLAACTALTSCSTAPSDAAGTVDRSSHVIRVVAAENFWGSIAEQLGGRQVEVASVIDNPDADPHAYEPTAADGRAIATADLLLVNGVGYDVWASRLAAANPVPSRVELTVGTLVGVPDDGNPHRWYNPADVQKVIDRITADYQQLDPADTAYFARRRAAFRQRGLADYRAVVAEIRRTYAGTPVGASESIVSMLAPALGLDLVTPPDFLKAVTQGADPTAADKATIDAQISGGQIKAYVYNSQNATPDIAAQVRAAKAAGIPVTSITETMTPADASWQGWQTEQLTRLRDALAAGTGR